jgi:hypothetical protein
LQQFAHISVDLPGVLRRCTSEGACVESVQPGFAPTDRVAESKGLAEHVSTDPKLIGSNDGMNPIRQDHDVECAQNLCQLSSEHVSVFVVLELLPEWAWTGELDTNHPLDIRCRCLLLAERPPRGFDPLLEPVEGIGSF